MAGRDNPLEFDDEQLSAYLDDELAPDERVRVEARLSADPAARQLLDELRTVSQAMKSLPHAALGDDLRESVLRRAERAILVAKDASAGTRVDHRTPPAVWPQQASLALGRRGAGCGIDADVRRAGGESSAGMPEQVALKKPAPAPAAPENRWGRSRCGLSKHLPQKRSRSRWMRPNHRHHSQMPQSGRPPVAQSYQTGRMSSANQT